MNRLQRIASAYKKASQLDYNEKFMMDREVLQFFKDMERNHGKWQQWLEPTNTDLKREKNLVEGEEYVLNKSTQKDLKMTSKLFGSRKEADKRLDNWMKGEKKAVEQLLKRDGLSGFSVEIDEFPSSYTPGGYGYGITLTYKGEQAEIEPSGYYYTDDGYNFSDAASSYDWAMLLGDESSPWADTYDFMDDYVYDGMSQWFSEAGSFEGDEDKITEEAKRLIEEAE